MESSQVIINLNFLFIHLAKVTSKTWHCHMLQIKLNKKYQLCSNQADLLERGRWKQTDSEQESIR